MNKTKLSVVRYYKKKFKKLNVSSAAEQYSETLVKVLQLEEKNGELKDRLIESMQEKEKEKKKEWRKIKRASEIMGTQVNTPI